MDETPAPPAEAAARPPSFPIHRSSDIAVLVQFYRGEIGRMTSWRDRLDRTTNWAIGAGGAMLSFTLATPESDHGLLIFAMLLVLLLLYIESRRYRFFDVYRTRVRLLERNIFAVYFDPEGKAPPPDWARTLAEDLHNPTFEVGAAQAMGRRLRRNYAWMFLILLAAWILKVTSGLGETGLGLNALQELVDLMALGFVPGWAVLVGVTALHGWLLYLMVRASATEGELAYGTVHV